MRRLPPPFDVVDVHRLARHQQLLALWRGLSAEELLADATVLVQLTAFSVRQEQLVIRAKAGVEAGASHDCSEWLDGDRRCGLCGHHCEEGGDR